MRTDLNAIETATILAALRLWQRTHKGMTTREIAWNSEPEHLHFAEVRPLSDAEIDDLCERINLGPELPAPPEGLLPPDVEPDDGPKFCPDCDRPSQFGGLCSDCRYEQSEALHGTLEDRKS